MNRRVDLSGSSSFTCAQHRASLYALAIIYQDSIVVGYFTSGSQPGILEVNEQNSPSGSWVAPKHPLGELRTEGAGQVSADVFRQVSRTVIALPCSHSGLLVINAAMIKPSSQRS